MELTDGDRQFRYWSHVQFLLHAETYFHQDELGLMPDAHWRPYARYMTKYIQSPGFKEAWEEIGAICLVKNSGTTWRTIL